MITFTIPGDADMTTELLESLIGYCVDITLANGTVQCVAIDGFTDDRERLAVDLWDDATGNPSGTKATVKLTDVTDILVY